MRQVFSVARFEFLSFAKSPTFIGMTIFMIALALIGPMIPSIIGLFGNVTAERTIAVVDTTGQFDATTIDAFIPPQATFFPTIEAARNAVSEGNYNYALELRDGSFNLYVTAMGIGIANLEHSIIGMYRHLHQMEQFQAAGIDPAQTAAIMGFTPTSDILTLAAGGDIVADTMDSFFENFIYAYVMAFILYFGIMIGGQYLLTTVIREKSTKTMELLITSCKAGRMLNGKVLGVGSAVLLQLLLMVGAAVVSMNISYAISDGDAFIVNLQSEIMVYLVLFFLLGFIMFSYIYATLASTVSRMEDASSISFLPQILIIGGFFASVMGMQNPGADWVVIVSHIPFFAPFVMFARIAMDNAATWEIALSIAVQVVTIVIIAILGARIYRMGTLMYGNKPKLKDLLAAFK